jgi:hypothetical protein
MAHAPPKEEVMQPHVTAQAESRPQAEGIVLIECPANEADEGWSLLLRRPRRPLAKESLHSATGASCDGGGGGCKGPD